MIDSLVKDNEKNEFLETKNDGSKKMLTNELIAKISNYLNKNDWIRLAYLLGFLPHVRTLLNHYFIIVIYTQLKTVA